MPRFQIYRGKKGEPVADVLKRADTAMYRAKEAGRDRVALPDRLPDDWQQILEPA